MASQSSTSEVSAEFVPILDDQLFEHAERVRDKVVLITGTSAIRAAPPFTNLILRCFKWYWERNCYALCLIRVRTRTRALTSFYNYSSSSKIVIGDLDFAGAEQTVADIIALGG